MEGPNSIEFTMKKKEDGRTMLIRAGIFTACIMPFLVITTFLMMYAQQFIVITAPAIILTIYLVWYTRRFTRIEYEYVIISGEFSIAAIYDNLSRKDLIKNIRIKDMHKIVPYHTNGTLLEAREIGHILQYCSDLEDPDIYIGIYDDDKRGRTAVIFNTCRKLVQIMKFYNALNVTVKDDFRF